MCIWYGDSRRMLGTSSDGVCATPPHDLTIADKSWLPPSWRVESGASKGAGHGTWSKPQPLTEEDAGNLVLLGFGIMLGLLICASACWLIYYTMKSRQQRRMGGAPTVTPSRSLGDIVPSPPVVVGTASPVPYASNYVAPTPPSTSSTTAPLVLSDSAQENAMVFDSSSSRV